MKFKELQIQPEQRLFFVTDIHGEIKALLGFLDSLGFIKGKDVCVCLGDLVDRGTDSLKTLLFFLSDTTGSFHCIRGNHDQFLVDQDWDCQLNNGGKWILDLMYEERAYLGSAIADKFPFVMEVKKDDFVLGCVHAGVPVEFTDWDLFVEELISGNHRLEQELIWMREIAEAPEKNTSWIPTLTSVDFTLHGHTPMDKPRMINNRIHMDTGYKYGGSMTIAEFKNGDFTFHSFKNKQED